MRSQNYIKFCSGKQVNLLVDPFDIFCFGPVLGHDFYSWECYLLVSLSGWYLKAQCSARSLISGMAGFQFLQEQPGSISIQPSDTQRLFSATPLESYVAYVCPELRQVLQGTQHINIWGPLCTAFS